MAVKRISSDIDVVTAARQRIKNVFSNGVPVYLSFSGGKDSIVLADLTYKLIQAGEINPSQLTVLFVDEEAIFDSIEATTKAWRKKFLLAGAKFQWWCIEVKHFSCLNELSSDKTFVCWDRRKRDVWVRQPPPFAIRNHPQLRPRIDNYQSFLPRVTMDGIMITGVRAAESIQRLQYMAALNMGAKGITGTNTIYPIYDWKTADVWLYLRDQRIEVPEVYLQMYQVGVNRNQLRVSQFFSVDTVPVLVHLGEYDPSLMERVLRREPNAYLAMLYWDSEMFHRTTRKRRELEGEDTKDYRALLKEMLFVRPGDFFNTEHKRKIAKQYHISNTYPHQITSEPQKWQRVEAYGAKTGLPNILHIMDSERPDQYRGVPYLAQVIEPLLQLRRYTESELMAALVQSFFTAWIETETDPSDTPFNEVGAGDIAGVPAEVNADGGPVANNISDDDNEYEMGPGTVMHLAPGEKVNFGNPNIPTAGFETFVKTLCKLVGAALELPYDVLIKEFNSSYSASRGALLEAWEAFKMRRKWFVDDFCQPVYEMFLAEAVALGRINAPGFFTDPLVREAWCGARWIGPVQGSLDPKKEAEAALMLIDNAIKTHEQVSREMSGGDWEENVEQLQRENELLTQAGGNKVTVVSASPKEGDGDED